MNIKYGELQANFEGSPDDTAAAFLNFLNTIHPTFHLAAQLTYQPDLTKLSGLLIGSIEYSADGLILLSTNLTADEAILIILLGVYVGSRLGVVTENTISVKEISNICGKASKTILNQIKNMIDEGCVTRVGKGEYQIKNRGIKRAEAVLVNRMEL